MKRGTPKHPVWLTRKNIVPFMKRIKREFGRMSEGLTVCPKCKTLSVKAGKCLNLSCVPVVVTPYLRTLFASMIRPSMLYNLALAKKNRSVKGRVVKIQFKKTKAPPCRT